MGTHLHVVLGVVSGWLIAAAGSVNSISGLGSDLQGIIIAAGTALAGIALGGGGLALAYHALARNFDADPARVAHHNASMRKVPVGEVIYRDEAAVLTQRWNHRDGAVAALSDTTSRALFMCEYPFADLPPMAVDDALAKLEQELAQISVARTRRCLLCRNDPEVEVIV